MFENSARQSFHLSTTFRVILTLLFCCLFFLLPMLLIEIFFNLGYPIFYGMPAYFAEPWYYSETHLANLWFPNIVRITIYATSLVVAVLALWGATKYEMRRINGSKKCIRWFGIYLCRRHARTLSIIALGSLFFYGYIIIQVGTGLISFPFRPPDDSSIAWILGSINVLIIMTMLTLFSIYTFRRMRRFDKNPSYYILSKNLLA